MKPWTEIYRPESTSEVVGNEDSVRELIKWAKGFNNNDSDGVLLYGPPGLGKTTVAHALASDLDLDVFEINASDERTANSIGDKLLNTAQSDGFLGNGRLVIIDEVDNLDRGGAQAVCSALDEATQRVVMTCNDYWDGVPNSIQNRTKNIEFEPVNTGPIAKRLMEICESQNINYDTEALRLIAERSEGDVRAAVNDLQSTVNSLSPITTERVQKNLETPDEKSVFFGDKDVDPKIARQLLEELFGSRDNLGKWVIRGAPGFDIVVAEYAARHDIPFELHLPKHEDYWGEWGDIYRMRLEEVLEDADSVQCVFGYEEPIDWDEYAYWFCNEDDTCYAWVGNDPDDVTEEVWGSDELDAKCVDISELFID